MKRDLKKPLTKWAQRALTAISGALTELLCARAFEEISASEIASAARLPRATFYNYFDDKYDLLNFYWHLVFHAPVFGVDEGTGEAPMVYFDRFYELLERNGDTVRRILEHNTPDGYLLASCRIFMTGEIKGMLEQAQPRSDRPKSVTPDLLAEHSARTILLILEKRFLRTAQLTKQDVQTAVHYLLSEL